MSTAIIQSDNSKERVNFFEDEGLNALVFTLNRLDENLVSFRQTAKQAMYNAFKTRWEYGKLIHTNYDKIIEVCGSQRNFADQIGKSEAVISNNKRGFEYLLKEGCSTWEEVIALLEAKQIEPIVTNFEKIGTLINNPTKDTTQKEQLDKDQLRLEQLRSEAEEILKRAEPMNKPGLVKDAFDVVEDIESIQKYISSFNPYHVKWESEKYLNHVRNYGQCLITGIPAQILDAHHTTPSGGAGPMGGKLADVFAIPVLREVHMGIEEGKINPSPEEILEAQFKCLASFIMLNLK